jgi:hypothetical protein
MTATGATYHLTVYSNLGIIFDEDLTRGNTLTNGQDNWITFDAGGIDIPQGFYPPTPSFHLI